MKKFLVVLAVFVMASSVYAKDRMVKIDIDKALSSRQAKGVLNPNIKMIFGNSNTKQNIIDRDLIVSKRGNKFGKPDEYVCTRVFLSVLKEFQKKALQLGGKKVVNITSYYNNNELDNKKYFECGVGLILGRVVLKGNIAK